MRLLPFVLLALSAPLAAAPGDPPVSGKPVPELTRFDDAMKSFMSQNDIEAGILGVMKDGEVVYLRGFGYLDPGIPWFGIPPTPLSEMAMMRLASCEKPLTAAAIHKLAASGAISLDDKVFDLGQWGGGILQIPPAGALGTQYLKMVTVQHLLDHTGGWDRDVSGFDPMFETVLIAFALAVPSPADREQIASFMLTQDIEWVPGTMYAYSNFGYMLLGLIVEHVTGKTLQQYVHEAVFSGPDWWVPSTELIRGRTFKSGQSPREPWYRSPWQAQNVFDPFGSYVTSSYGGWHHEAMVGHGNLVASVPPLLHFLDEYVTVGGSIGLPKGGAGWTASHSGVLDGTNTIMRQRDDDVHVVVLFNDRGNPHYASEMAGEIYELADTVITTWPTASVEGFWVDPGGSSFGFGGYHDPLPDVAGALSSTTHRSRWRLKPGTTSWKGVIDRRVLVDSPLAGSTVIGQ